MSRIERFTSKRMLSALGGFVMITATSLGEPQVNAQTPVPDAPKTPTPTFNIPESHKIFYESYQDSNRATATAVSERATRESVIRPTPSVTPAPEPISSEENCSGHIGDATYYDLHGGITSSGEIMDRSKLTAASMRYPDGTYVRVNRMDEKDMSVVVKINDSGDFENPKYNNPLTGERIIIDLSPEAAKRIDMLQLGRVRVCVTKLQ